MSILRSFLMFTGIVTKKVEELARMVNESSRVKGLFGGENIVVGRGLSSERWETEQGRRMYGMYCQYLCFVDKAVTPEAFIKLYKLDKGSLQNKISKRACKIINNP